MSETPSEPFERWIAAFRGPLIGLCASFGLDWSAAEELAQDVFAEAWLARARFAGDPDEVEAVGAWLRGIAFHLWRARARRLERRAALSLPEGVAAPVEEEDERRAELVRAFATLDEGHQTVLRMHYLEETSAREVAALLGTTPKALEMRLYQARRALRERVERQQRHAAAEVRR
jgi:RNA polymerase sigma-70 factor (ECF subfamily)